MKIILKYSNNHSIKISLINNNAIKKWFNTFKGTEYCQSAYIVPRHRNSNININVEWEKIKENFVEIKSWGLNIPFDIPDQFIKDQQILNTIHRFFTYNLSWYSCRFKKNQYDKSFVVPLNVTEKKWRNHFHSLNTSVHLIESNVLLTNTPEEIYSLLGKRMHSLHFHNDESKWLQFNDEDLSNNYNFLDNIYDMPVMLDDSILGKSILESYFTDDDPNQPDCTGRVGSHGGFYVDFYNERKKIYEGKFFKTWANKHKLDLSILPYEFMIGYVERTSFKDLQFYSSNKFAEIFWED